MKLHCKGSGYRQRWQIKEILWFFSHSQTIVASIEVPNYFTTTKMSRERPQNLALFGTVKTMLKKARRKKQPVSAFPNMSSTMQIFILPGEKERIESRVYTWHPALSQPWWIQVLSRAPQLPPRSPYLRLSHWNCTMLDAKRLLLPPLPPRPQSSWSRAGAGLYPWEAEYEWQHRSLS